MQVDKKRDVQLPAPVSRVSAILRLSQIRIYSNELYSSLLFGYLDSIKDMLRLPGYRTTTPLSLKICTAIRRFLTILANRCKGLGNLYAFEWNGTMGLARERCIKMLRLPNDVRWHSFQGWFCNLDITYLHLKMKLQFLALTALASFTSASPTALDKRAHITGTCSHEQWTFVTRALGNCVNMATRAARAAVMNLDKTHEYFKYVLSQGYYMNLNTDAA